MAAQRQQRGTAMRPVRLAGRLAMRQALSSALLALALGIGFSVLQVKRDFTETTAAEQREIAQMLAVMREPAVQAAYQLSEPAAAVVVHGALSFAPVIEASLRNDFGETLARGRHDVISPADDVWWARFVEPTHAYTLPLEHGAAKKRVGELRVVTSQGPRVERFLQGMWRELGLSILRSLIIVLALSVLFYRTLTRPLTAIARRIRGGPPIEGDAARSQAARRDEIGEIAAAFERYEREARERALSLEASAAALTASEARYRRVVETALEGVWQIDAQGRTTLANEAMAQMLGTTVPEMVGRSLFDFMDGAGRQTAEQLLRRRLGGSSERHDFRFVRADGSELWAELSTCPITGPDGQVAGALAMVTDATERRRRDEELRAGNAQLRAMVGHLERHNHDMAQIAELNELLQSARSEPEAFDVIRSAGERLFPEGSGGLSITAHDGEMMRVGQWGSPAWVPPHFARSDCWAIRRGGPHVQSPERGVRCIHHPGDPIGNLVCTPLYVEGELLGVLHTADGGCGSLRDEALRQRVEIFGEVIKLGLSNLRLRESLREQALRDALTGLPNRRLFDETLRRELARSNRSGHALTLASIDVDKFKQFNDSHGHDVGDQVLRWVATTLTHSIRSGDLACRYGGDEFLCLMVDMSADEARARFEHLLEHARSDLDPALGARVGRVGLTVGLACAPACAADAAGLLRAADAALYAAKARGGRCVEVAVPAVQAEAASS